MTDIEHSAGSGALTERAPIKWLRRNIKLPGPVVTRELIVLFAVSLFPLFYGLIPVFGGAQLGLVGADEPRYAQIAREMLLRHDYVTPVLWGHPWLEKPALYYWRAMFAFLEFGVHDWSARLPSASFAF